MSFIYDMRKGTPWQLLVLAIGVLTSARASAQWQPDAGAYPPPPSAYAADAGAAVPAPGAYAADAGAPLYPASAYGADGGVSAPPVVAAPPPSEVAADPGAAPPPLGAEIAPAEVAPDATADAPLADDASADAQAEDRSDELGAIIVSARRRNESVQEIPVAISVLSGDDQESKGAVSLQSFHKEIPSVTTYASNARNTTINIRGLGTGVSGAGAAGLDSGVGFYVDDVYFGRLSQAILNLVDIDRIEVLRGPQGTLFGRNTTAGAISVVTRAPSFSTEGTLDLSVGNYGYFQARGSLSGPIFAKKLAARISFEAQSRNGFLYSTQLLDTIHRQESYTVRGQLLYQATPRLKFRLIGDYSKLGQSCCQQSAIGEINAYDNGRPVAYPYATRVGQFPGYTPEPYDPGSRRVDTDRQRFFRVGLGGASLRADWDLRSHTLTSIAAARAWRTKPRNDGDGTALDAFRESNDDDKQIQLSEELRIASNETKWVDYVGGLYFFYQHLPTYLRRDYGPQAGEFYIAPNTQGLSPEQRRAVLDGAYSRTTTETNTLSVAGFAQATFHIPTGTDVTGGIRYTWERKYGDYRLDPGGRIDPAGLNPAQVRLREQYIAGIPYYELDKSWSSLGALATLSQHIDADRLLYATYSRGSKSGGLNFRDLPRDDAGNVQPGLLILKPETVDHFEAGLKSQWLKHRLTVNVTGFYTEIRDYQNTVVDTSRATARTYLSNVGAVRSRGVELELRARPVQGLNVYASGTYNPAEYKSYKTAQCPWEKRAPGEPVVCDLSGQQLPVAPKYAGAAGGDWTFPITRSVSGFAGVDYSYRSSYTTTTNNSRYSRVKAIGLLNARVGIKDAEGSWQANLWSQNLLDNLYFVHRGVNETTYRYSGLLGDPRTFGGTFRYYFD